MPASGRKIQEEREFKEEVREFIEFIKMVFNYPIDSLKRTYKKSRFLFASQIIFLVVIGVLVGYMYVRLFDVGKFFTHIEGKVFKFPPQTIPGTTVATYQIRIQPDKGMPITETVTADFYASLNNGDIVVKPFLSTSWVKKGQSLSFGQYLQDLLFLLFGLFVFGFLFVSTVSFVSLLFNSFIEDEETQKKKKKGTKSRTGKSSKSAKKTSKGRKKK